MINPGCFSQKFYPQVYPGVVFFFLKMVTKKRNFSSLNALYKIRRHDYFLLKSQNFLLKSKLPSLVIELFPSSLYSSMNIPTMDRTLRKLSIWLVCPILSFHDRTRIIWSFSNIEVYILEFDFYVPEKEFLFRGFCRLFWVSLLFLYLLTIFTCLIVLLILLLWLKILVSFNLRFFLFVLLVNLPLSVLFSRYR